jgi:hypothetical protein
MQFLWEGICLNEMVPRSVFLLDTDPEKGLRQQADFPSSSSTSERQPSGATTLRRSRRSRCPSPVTSRLVREPRAAQGVRRCRLDPCTDYRPWLEAPLAHSNDAYAVDSTWTSFNHPVSDHRAGNLARANRAAAAGACSCSDGAGRRDSCPGARGRSGPLCRRRLVGV